MTECPVCFGEGSIIDLRDMDTYFGEHFSDAELAQHRATGLVHPVGIVECTECDGTGDVSDDRYRDLIAVARAAVDQALARVRDEDGAA